MVQLLWLEFCQKIKWQRNFSRIPVGILLTKEASIAYCPYCFEKKSPPLPRNVGCEPRSEKNANKAGLIDSSLQFSPAKNIKTVVDQYLLFSFA